MRACSLQMCDTLLGIFLQPYWYFAITNLTAYVLERLFTRGIPWILGYKITIDKTDSNLALNKQSSFNPLRQDGTVNDFIMIAEESGAKQGVQTDNAGAGNSTPNNLTRIESSAGAIQLQSIIKSLIPQFVRDFLQNIRYEHNVLTLKQTVTQQEAKINQMRASGSVESGLVQQEEERLSQNQIEMERLQDEINNYRQSRQSSKVIDTFRESLLTQPTDLDESKGEIPEIVQRFQDAYNGLQVILALTTLLSAAVSSAQYSDSHWKNYQRMILVLNNSMVLAFWLSSFQSSSRVPFVLCSLFLLPGIITHVLPALFLYIWFLPLIFLFSIFAIWMAFSLLSIMLRPCLGDATALRINTMLAANVIARSLFPLLLVIATDYAVLFYTGSGYAGVIADDVRLRHQARCYFDGMFDNLDQSLVMFNWI